MNNGIQIIQNLVVQLRSKSRRIEELELEVKQLKEQRKEIEEVSIPDTMSELGVTAVTLESHEIVTVKPFYYARVPQEPENFFKWLRENGHGGMIKEKYDIYPGEQAELLLELLKEFKFEYESSSTIHWRTLEAWYKECRENGMNLPEDLFPHYEGRKAQVKG